MTLILIPWVVAFICFALFWIIQIACFQIFNPKMRIRFLNRLCIVFIPLVFMTSLLIQHTYPPSMQPNPYLISCIEAAAYFFMIYFFSFAFYSLVEHAVRVRMAVELYLAQGKPLTYQELLANVQPDRAMVDRLEQLIRGGYVERAAEGFCLTTQGKHFVARALVIRRVLKIQYEY